MMLTANLVPVLATGLSLGSSMLVALLALADCRATADIDGVRCLGDDAVARALTRVSLPLEFEAPTEIGSVR